MIKKSADYGFDENILMEKQEKWLQDIIVSLERKTCLNVKTKMKLKI